MDVYIYIYMYVYIVYAYKTSFKTKILKEHTDFTY